VLWAAGAAAAPLDPDQEANLRPLTRWLRDSGRNTLASSFIAALTTVQSRARAAIQATASFAAVLTPTLASPPVPVDFFRNDDDPAVDFEAQKRFTPYTSPYNMTGQPAITLPVHWNRAGLPIGVQLVGRPADEAGLLSLAAQVMAARPLPRSPLW
jgi:amidase